MNHWGDAFTRKFNTWPLTLTLWSRSHERLPSTLYTIWLIQLQTFKLLYSNCLGGDTFTRNVTDRWTDGRRTDFGTKLIHVYPFFLKKKAGIKINDTIIDASQVVLSLFLPNQCPVLRQQFRHEEGMQCSASCLKTWVLTSIWKICANNQHSS